MGGCPEWVRTLNLWSDKVMHADPYPRYAELREHCPMAWSEELGGHWLVTRHADIVRILHDPETFSSVTKTLPAFPDPLGVQIPGEVDGIEHTRYRQAIIPWLSPGSVATLDDTARRVIRRLFTEVGPPGFEFVHEIAIPYVFEVTMHLFGIAEEHWELLRSFEDGGLRRAPHDEALTLEIGAFITREVETRRADPPDVPSTLLDRLALTPLSTGRLLTLGEAVRMAVFLLKAALHTTVNALGNSVAWLADHAAVRDEILARPDIVGGVLEELMRLESILVITRTATRDVQLGDHAIKAGDHLLLLTGSAGRDEDRFDAPDLVDIDRPQIDHLMFGSGPHRCAGRHVARLELRLALEELHAAYPAFRADPDCPAKRYTAMSRGARELRLLV